MRELTDSDMTKNEFKIGDKVVTAKYYNIDINGYSATIPIGEVGVIDAVIDADLFVCFNRYGLNLIRPASEFEPLQSLDRKTAFLTELQVLLRKYDARIYDEDEYKVIIDLDIHCEKSERIECIGTDGEVNADNIMNFNKE